jgi:hypothetical protein
MVLLVTTRMRIPSSFYKILNLLESHACIQDWCEDSPQCWEDVRGACGMLSSTKRAEDTE